MACIVFKLCNVKSLFSFQLSLVNFPRADTTPSSSFISLTATAQFWQKAQSRNPINIWLSLHLFYKTSKTFNHYSGFSDIFSKLVSKTKIGILSLISVPKLSLILKDRSKTLFCSISQSSCRGLMTVSALLAHHVSKLTFPLFPSSKFGKFEWRQWLGSCLPMYK